MSSIEEEEEEGCSEGAATDERGAFEKKGARFDMGYIALVLSILVV